MGRAWSTPTCTATQPPPTGSTPTCLWTCTAAAPRPPHGCTSSVWSSRQGQRGRGVTCKGKHEGYKGGQVQMVAACQRGSGHPKDCSLGLERAKLVRHAAILTWCGNFARNGEGPSMHDFSPRDIVGHAMEDSPFLAVEGCQSGYLCNNKAQVFQLMVAHSSCTAFSYGRC